MTVQTDLTPSQIVARGKEIYEAGIRQQLEAQNVGKYLMINIESGQWVTGDDHLQTALDAWEQFGNAQIYGMRIGYLATESMGGALYPVIAPAQESE